MGAQQSPEAALSLCWHFGGSLKEKFLPSENVWRILVEKGEE